MADASLLFIDQPEGIACSPVAGQRERLPELLGAKRPLEPLLDQLEVAVIGAGSVGRCVCLHAARLKPKMLLIVDPAHYKSEGLLTQPILPHEVGVSKARSTGEVCKSISPGTTVFACQDSVQSLSPAALARVNIVFLAADNLHAEVCTGGLCQRLALPLIQASVCGELLVAQVRCWSHRDPSGPCVLCGFGTDEWAQFNRETLYSCQGPSGGTENFPPNAAQTRSVSFLCSLAADLALMQGLRHVAELGQPVADTMLEFCGYTHRSVISPLARHAGCPGPHERWLRKSPPKDLARSTPRELINIATGTREGLGGVSLAVGHHYFAESGKCAACGQQRHIGRFVPTLSAIGPCPACGGQIDGQPFYAHSPVPAEVLGDALDRELGAMVPGAIHAVVVRCPERSVLFCAAQHAESHAEKCPSRDADHSVQFFNQTKGEGEA
jgi:molybdopterin/thiamine biosynthesis adenylyltransferase